MGVRPLLQPWILLTKLEIPRTLYFLILNRNTTTELSYYYEKLIKRMQIPSTFHSSTWLRQNAGREPRSPPKYPGNFSYRITSLPKCIYSIRCSLPFRLFVSTPFALTTTRTTGLGECIRPIIRTCYEKQTATLDCGESMQFTMKSTRTYWKYNSPRENFPSSISLLLFHSFFLSFPWSLSVAFRMAAAFIHVAFSQFTKTSIPRWIVKYAKWWW